MREMFLGEYIKQERLKQGITQEQLCDGICEPITVSRLENGKQTPSYSRICAFLQRLGLPDNQYFALLNKNEMEVKVLQDEILADAVRFKRAAPEDQPSIRAEGLKKLEALERIVEKDDQIIQQYILSNKVTFGNPNGPYSPENRLDILLKALHMTVPNCDLDELNLGRYTLDEITLLNMIAATYAEMGQQIRATDIYRQLLKYVEKYNKRMSRYAGKVSLIAHNYALELFLMKRYDDAIEIAELGQKACVEYPHYQFLPGLLDIMGGCYFYKGNLKQCKKYYRDAHALYRVTGNDSDRISLEKAVKERLGLEFPF